ncbi:MAG: hypothetical protein BGP16_13080 [Sphingobium sp. 66-54]|nr:MAG: hypothetical protein BGP16_13080 [Sphingobium sp. 66-54]
MDADISFAWAVCVSRQLRLCRIPQVWRHDPKLRQIVIFPQFRCVRAGDAIAGVRVFNHLDPVPDHLASIQRVAKDTVTTLRIAVDGGCIPFRAPRGANTVPIEAMGDVPWGLPARELRINAEDHVGLFLNDHPLALVHRVGAIAISLAPC